MHEISQDLVRPPDSVSEDFRLFTLIDPAFRVVVLKTPTEVLNLASGIQELLAQTGQSDEIVMTPDYFLARAREKNARPFVIVVYDVDQLVGIVYGIKRCVLGIPMGLIECGDSCGDTSVLANEDSFQKVVDAALSVIAAEPFTVIARISWSAHVLKAKERPERAWSGFVTRTLNLYVWSMLSLQDTYEQFLGSLGSQTRRNMRANRRHAEHHGWTFLSDVSSVQATAALEAIFPFQAVGRAQKAELRRYQQTLNNVPGLFFSGLQTESGEWISIIGGWVKGKEMFILLQLNHASYAKASVSAVLRGYVIERAIQSGIRSVKFIDGCGGILRKYSRQPSSHVLMQRQRFPGALFAWLISKFLPLSAFGKLLSDSHTELESIPPPE